MTGSGLARLVAGCVLALLAAGCSGDPADPEADSSPTSAGPSPSDASEASPSVRPGPDGRLPATDGRDTQVVARIKVGTNPCGVLVAFGSAWVTDAAEARLFRISLADDEVVASYPLDDKPCELTAADGSLWVTTQSGRVDRVDPATGRVLDRVKVGSASYETLPAFGSLWTSNRNDGTLSQIDPATGRSTSHRLESSVPGGLVAADGYLWVGNDAAGSTTIRRVDPTTWEVTEVETGGSRPAWLAVTPGVVWAAQMSSGTMVGIDTSTLAPIGLPAPAGFSPVNLEATPDGRWVWVPDDYDNFLTRVDAATGDAVERLKVGLGPAVVSASNDEVWVTNFAEGSVWRLRLGR